MERKPRGGWLVRNMDPTRICWASVILPWRSCAFFLLFPLELAVVDKEDPGWDRHQVTALAALGYEEVHTNGVRSNP